MSSLRAWCLRFTGLFDKERKDRELAEELESHLQFHIEDNLRDGMSPSEARREAILKLGGVEPTRENYRKRRSIPFIESLLQDLRFGLRLLKKSPGFTTVAVLTLALGIGANTAMFSVIDAVLLSPLPFKNPDRLVQLWETETAPGNYPFSGPDYLDWQAQNSSFADMTLYSYGSIYNVNDSAGSSEPASAIETEANFFSVLGDDALIGRTFAIGEDKNGAQKVAILSYAYWRSRFGGAADLVGKTINLNAEAYSIFGVMKPELNFFSTDIWVPMDVEPGKVGSRGQHSYLAIGRLKSTASAASALADVSTIAGRLQREYPRSNERVGAMVIPLKAQITQDSRPGLLILLGAVTLVLLVASINLANLMLARTAKRHREVSLRASLGADRTRLVRQLLTESILLSLCGALLGLVFAEVPLHILQSVESLPIPTLNPIHLNVTVLLFTLIVSVAVGVLFGLTPALQVSRLDLNVDLKSQASSALLPKRQRALHDFLIVGELAWIIHDLAGEKRKDALKG